MDNFDDIVVTEPTAFQKKVSNAFTGGFIVLLGIFLVLCGINVIPLDLFRVLAISILSAIMLSLLVTSIVQRNIVSVWLASFLVMPILVEILTLTQVIDYSKIYPLYITAPAFACLVTMLFSHEWLYHIKISVFFAIVAGICFLSSLGVVTVEVVLALFIMLVGLLVVYTTLIAKRSDEEVQ